MQKPCKAHDSIMQLELRQFLLRADCNSVKNKELTDFF